MFLNYSWNAYIAGKSFKDKRFRDKRVYAREEDC